MERQGGLLGQRHVLQEEQHYLSGLRDIDVHVVGVSRDTTILSRGRKDQLERT